ncbi:MAG TPA: hypothetical protein VGM32_08920 [Rhodopila sp.]
MHDQETLPTDAWIQAKVAFGWLAFNDPCATADIDMECANYIGSELERTKKDLDTSLSEFRNQPPYDLLFGKRCGQPTWSGRPRP